MAARLDIGKGQQPIVHFYPETCRNIRDTPHQSLNIRTAANGVTNKQWTLCLDCNRDPAL